MSANKLNGLTLEQARLLIAGLEAIEDNETQFTESECVDLSQLRDIRDYLTSRNGRIDV